MGQVKGEFAVVTKLPLCDFCLSEDGVERPARYDFATKFGGSWANGCVIHLERYGPGRLGTGYGQRLILPDEREDKP